MYTGSVMNDTPHHSPTNQLRLVFWETTTACNLKCIHCRATATDSRPPDELTTEQSFALVREIASFARCDAALLRDAPVVVLSGGEPLVRPDIFEIARLGTDLGLRMVLATNGTTLERNTPGRLLDSGVQRISVSIDGAGPEVHDSFRGIQSSFEAALRGIGYSREAGLPVQINTTVARHNLHELPSILELAVREGACALHLFLLVPTGCGKEISKREMIGPEQYEQVLGWLYDASRRSPINLKATCAPHYHRVMRQRAKAEGVKITPETHGLQAVTKGCLAGSAVCFVSYRGDVYPCGYFPVSAGNVLETPLSRIWEESELFASLRDPSLLEGKCGACEYARVCGGCRARAYAETGNCFAEEPYCAYEPWRNG